MGTKEIEELYSTLGDVFIHSYGPILSTLIEEHLPSLWEEIRKRDEELWKRRKEGKLTTVGIQLFYSRLNALMEKYKKGKNHEQAGKTDSF